MFCKGFFKQIGILAGIGIGYVISIFLNQVDLTLITQATVFQIPKFSFPKFDLESIIIIAPIVITVFMEHIGDMTTNGAVVGKNFMEDPGLNMTLLGDSLATMVSGFIGGPTNTTYGENTAVLAITKNYNPMILRLTFIYAILLSCIGVFGAFLQSIPSFVMGGVSIMLFSMISYIGIKTMKDSECLNKNKNNLIIIFSIIIIGIGIFYMAEKGIVIGIPITENISITGLSLSSIVGIVLNRIINHKEFKKVVNN